MLSRYHNIEFILNLPYCDGVKLINKAIEKEKEAKLWSMWLTLYPNMDSKNFIPFSEFASTTPIIDKDNDEELLAELQSAALIDKNMHEGVKNSGNI